MTDVLIKRENLDTDTDTHRGKMMWRYRGKRQLCGWNDACTGQRMARIDGKHQKLKEERKSSPLEPSERAWPC